MPPNRLPKAAPIAMTANEMAARGPEKPIYSNHAIMNNILDQGIKPAIPCRTIRSKVLLERIFFISDLEIL